PGAAIDLKTDSDRDGLTGHEEYLSGTDPWDKESFFSAKVTINSATGSPEMEFNPVSTERRYTLEYSSDVANGTWRPVAGMTSVQMLNCSVPGRLAISPAKNIRIYRVTFSAPRSTDVSPR